MKKCKINNTDFVVRTVTLSLLNILCYYKFVVKNHPMGTFSTTKALYILTCLSSLILCLLNNIKANTRHIIITSILPVCIYSFLILLVAYPQLALLIIEQTILLSLLFSFYVLIFENHDKQSITGKFLFYSSCIFIIHMLIIVSIVLIKQTIV